MNLISTTEARWVATLAAILVFLTSANAFAARPVDYDKLTAQCIRTIDGPVTGTMDECTRASIKRSDAEMRRLMIGIEGILRERRRDEDGISKGALAMIEDIKRAQVHWRQERDALCRFRTQLIGPVEGIVCPLQQNIIRVKELRALWTEIRSIYRLAPATP